jgi:antiviral helicase SKI2
MSLQRAPGPPGEAVRGSSTNYPFWPGGFPELLLQEENEDKDVEIDFVNSKFHFNKPFRFDQNLG